jgi:hypothetical protein
MDNIFILFSPRGRTVYVCGCRHELCSPCFTNRNIIYSFLVFNTQHVCEMMRNPAKSRTRLSCMQCKEPRIYAPINVIACPASLETQAPCEGTILKLRSNPQLRRTRRNTFATTRDTPVVLRAPFPLPPDGFSSHSEPLRVPFSEISHAFSISSFSSSVLRRRWLFSCLTHRTHVCR